MTIPTPAAIPSTIPKFVSAPSRPARSSAHPQSKVARCPCRFCCRRRRGGSATRPPPISHHLGTLRNLRERLPPPQSPSQSKPVASIRPTTHADIVWPAIPAPAPPPASTPPPRAAQLPPNSTHDDARESLPQFVSPRASQDSAPSSAPETPSQFDARECPSTHPLSIALGPPRHRHQSSFLQNFFRSPNQISLSR